MCVSICLSINYHCCTPHTLCNMIFIGHPLTCRSFKKALVSRPNRERTVCMHSYVAIAAYVYVYAIYTILYCVCMYVYVHMYCTL